MKSTLRTYVQVWIAISTLALVYSPMTAIAAPWETPTAPDPKGPNPKEPDPKEPDPKEVEFFEKKIRPILVDNCYICHSEHHKEAGGLRVDDFRALTGKGRTGFAVIPGDAEGSLLIQRVTHSDDDRTMPPDRRLSEEQIQDLKTWINRGAAWPPLVIPRDVDQTLEEGIVPNEDLKESHWAWQPLAKPTPPTSSSDSQISGWARNEVDQFIAAKLEEKNLLPVPDAHRSVLLRRLTYDLTGLPPTEEELVAFLLDDSEQAIERVVDRLLASTAFGERWGRHWLDVARYGESTGSARNLPYPHAWRYRDYVIESFNKDKPFDRFLREQIAGDLLHAETPEEEAELGTATGFLALGVKDVNQRFQVRYEMDNVDEQIDTVSRAVLGLTVSCARCHDHKFDPISTRDYYAIAGIFTSTELHDALRNQMGGGGLAYYVPDRLIRLGNQNNTTISEEVQAKIDEKKSEFEEARAKFVSIRDSVKPKDRDPDHTRKLQQARQAMNRKQAELVALSDPAVLGPVALGVRDSKTIGDTEIRIRGEAEKRGPLVPRGFLTLLENIQADPIPKDQSGRKELAQWLTDESNPLTTRVIVNRIWKNLFSEGLVRTVDNFGVTGDEPSHPELLDFLANKFVEEGWSHKKLIRYLVLSRAYQLSSHEREDALAQDPSNKWLWRHSPRRLDAEELRDSILSIAGTLKRGSTAEPASKDLPVIEIRNNGREAKALIEAASASQHRSVYLPMVRGILHDVLQVFDFAEQGMVTGKRSNTTVPPQSLFLLNDPFIRQHSLRYAASLVGDSGNEIESKIAHLYLRTFQRYPTSTELQRALSFLEAYQIQFKELKEKRLEQERDEQHKEISSLGSAGKEGANKAVAEVTPEANAAAPEDGRGIEAPVEGGLALDPSTSEEAALSALVQALFASAEFRFVR